MVHTSDPKASLVALNMPSPRIAVIQPVVPDYRVPLFASLHERFGDRFAVYAGLASGGGTICMDSRAAGFVRTMENRHFLGESFVWQSGHGRDLLAADVVVAPGSLRFFSSQWLVWNRRRRGLPTVLWGHAHGNHAAAWLLRRAMFRAASGYIAYTRSDGDVIRRVRGDNNVWVASNSCVWKKECRPLFTALQPINVVCIGRLIDDKKPFLLVDAFAMATSRGAVPPETKLVFTGDGPLAKEIRARADRLGLGSRVVLTGHVSDRSQLELLYAEALIAVAPGTLGLSAIQAFAAGVPKLISRDERHGPEIEACKDGFNTVFFETGSASSLASGIARVFREAPEWRARRGDISQAVAEEYTYDRMVEAFVAAIASFTAV